MIWQHYRSKDRSRTRIKNKFNPIHEFMIHSRTIKRLASVTGVLATTVVFAQQATSQAKEESTILSNGVFLAMLSMIILLLFVIIGMSEVVKAGAAYQLKKKKDAADKSKIAATILFVFAAGALWAQDATTTTTAAAVSDEPFNYWRMGAITFYIMLSIIIFEILMIYMLFRTSMHLLDRDEMRARKKAEQKVSATEAFIEKMNASVAVEEEAAILMDHDYDGIRELDNNLPPWWKYGFYVTIVFAVIYLFHFHIFKTGKLSGDEYLQQIKDGEAEVAEYKKTAADLVDEKTVTLLTDPASLNSGKIIFEQNCKACHGPEGQGMTGSGPNFTDDYWLHGGSVQDVFKSIKYGWPDKGMREWGSEIKAKNIQELASYIKSLRGTNPPNQQPKQGELYIEEGAKPQTDSAAAADSVPPKPITDSLKK